MQITMGMLLQADACNSQIAIFAEEWPEGGEVTLATCQRAEQLGLDLDWAAESLLKAPAWAEYKKVKAAALAEYEKVKAPAFVAAVALQDTEGAAHDARHDGERTDTLM